MSLRSRIESWRARTSLLQQLQTAAVGISVVLGASCATVLALGEYHTARSSLLQHLGVQARIIASNSSAAVAFGDGLAGHEMLAALQTSPDIVGARLLLADGSVLADYHAASTPGAAFWSQRFVLTEPVQSHGEQFGTLELTGDYASLNRRLVLYIAAIALVVTMGVVLAMIAFRHVAKLLTQPVAQLSALMRRVSDEGDYRLRSDISANNEFGDIAQSFNRMLEQIGQRDSALARELDERRQTETRLAYLASHDSLTGLGNRGAFMQAMEPARAGEPMPPLCLQLLDVDHFKLVNDSLGHHAGDHLLMEVALRLRSLRDEQIEVYRIGGDEFAVLLRGRSDAASARQLAQRITDAIGAPFSIVGQELFTSLSIGIALCPEHAQGAEPLLNCADLALYQAKSLGRDRWTLFTPELKETVEQRMRLEADLRHAIERDELFLVFEPQVTLADGWLAGIEALVRWQHPEFGLLQPARFIPLAEECGLIHRLGEWVLRRACRDAMVLRAALGWRMPRLAVNLSPRQLADPAIVELVAQVLSDSGLPGTALELEVTESVMIEKLDVVSGRMRAIAALGVSFSMDDFGVGATSLSYLRRLPLSKIKIDRCFVHELPQNEDDAAVAAAIATLGLRLGIPVLAEGVETAEQLACLRDAGCSMAQGYLFSRPQILPDFVRYLESNPEALPMG